MDFPEGRRYNSTAGMLKREYGERLQKLVLDAGFSCPNRDGTVGTGGCTYCDNAAFHPGYSTPGKSLLQQIDEGIEFHRVRYPRVKHYLAYFQSYSNTYAPLERLQALYGEALSHPDVIGIVIGNVTLKRINRGHDFECARRAVEMTAERGIRTGAHFILGLPGETREMMLEQCKTISSLPLDSVKFHQLQIVKGTRMEQEYSMHPEDFMRLPLDAYLDFMIDILERLRPDLGIERIVGEVPPRFVTETPWGLIRNVEILRLLDKRLEERDTFQGRLWQPLRQ